MCPEKRTVKKAPVKAPFGDSVKINRVSRFVRILIVLDILHLFTGCGFKMIRHNALVHFQVCAKALGLN